MIFNIGFGLIPIAIIVRCALLTALFIDTSFSLSELDIFVIIESPIGVAFVFVLIMEICMNLLRLLFSWSILLQESLFQ